MNALPDLQPLTAYERAYTITAALLDLADSIGPEWFPGPTKLNEALHGRRSRNLNGVETLARADCLIAAGYVKHEDGRWVLA